MPDRVCPLHLLEGAHAHAVSLTTEPVRQAMEALGRAPTSRRAQPVTARRSGQPALYRAKV
ncbi:hypothetical protein FHR33_002813 [Nonomuraea dietziae]|uniref:Uncharacterized protein n=1 Tax=Nonomuraea dietziae TaxID=65515 RepID=A0A7W5YAG3_9ACTN|nr:hypothetical protein [Nonomuraea dietziae]